MQKRQQLVRSATLEAFGDIVGDGDDRALKLVAQAVLPTEGGWEFREYERAANWRAAFHTGSSSKRMYFIRASPAMIIANLKSQI